MDIMNWFYKLFQKPQQDKELLDSDKFLPDSSNFAELIGNNKIYVDKTALIARFVQEKGPFFISRPRRFGKSTLISTLYELFAHGLTKFQGLKFEQAYKEINRNHSWPNKTYKVIRLDFSEFREFDTASEFKTRFKNKLIEALENNHLPLGKMTLEEPADFFSSALDKAKEQYVLLIDEYDAPLTASYDNDKKFEAVRKIISSFYLNIKSHLGNFRFIFITGVCYYAHVSMFSGFNIATDLTLSSTYGALLGYTQEELESYFSEYLNNAVEVLNTKYAKQNPQQAQPYTREQLLADLKRHYDGYCFDSDNQYRLYNPWSIIQFLKDPIQEFKAYWFDTGGFMPTLLEKYITNTFEATQQGHYDLNLLLDLDTTCNQTSEKLLPKVEKLSTINPFAMLYQAGYFTIREKVSTNSFDVGLPNLEVKKAYGNVLIQLLSDKKQITIDQQALVECFKNCDIPKLQNVCSKMVNEMAYDAIRVFNEASYREMFRMALNYCGLETATEVMSAFGRADLMVYAGKYLYVIEMKLVHREVDIAKKLEEAKEQIITRQYDVRLTTKKVVALALVINQCTVSKSSKKSTETTSTPHRQPIVVIKQVNISES